MKGVPRVGDVGKLTFRVELSHMINVSGDGDLAVLSTPALIWHLEHAACNALADLLETNETSVGVAVDVEHLAATPRGHEVTCVAKIVHVERAQITFQVTAEDEREPIARGVHKRRVVGKERFRDLVRRKLKT